MTTMWAIAHEDVMKQPRSLHPLHTTEPGRVTPIHSLGRRFSQTVSCSIAYYIAIVMSRNSRDRAIDTRGERLAFE